MKSFESNTSSIHLKYIPIDKELRVQHFLSKWQTRRALRSNLSRVNIKNPNIKMLVVDRYTRISIR